MSPKLTINAGVRWDVFPPWVEVDDRQSNFDESTGRFVVASDDAVINGVQVGRYLQTYSKGDIGPRLGFAYDVRGTGLTLLRGGIGKFWNFTPSGTSSIWNRPSASVLMGSMSTVRSPEPRCASYGASRGA